MVADTPPYASAERVPLLAVLCGETAAQLEAALQDLHSNESPHCLRTTAVLANAEPPFPALVEAVQGVRSWGIEAAASGIAFPVATSRLIVLIVFHPGDPPDLESVTAACLSALPPEAGEIVVAQLALVGDRLSDMEQQVLDAAYNSPLPGLGPLWLLTPSTEDGDALPGGIDQLPAHAASLLYHLSENGLHEFLGRGVPTAEGKRLVGSFGAAALEIPRAPILSGFGARVERAAVERFRGPEAGPIPPGRATELASIAVRPIEAALAARQDAWQTQLHRIRDPLEPELTREHAREFAHVDVREPVQSINEELARELQVDLGTPAMSLSSASRLIEATMDQLNQNFGPPAAPSEGAQAKASSGLPRGLRGNGAATADSARSDLQREARDILFTGLGLAIALVAGWLILSSLPAFAIHPKYDPVATPLLVLASVLVLGTVYAAYAGGVPSMASLRQAWAGVDLVPSSVMRRIIVVIVLATVILPVFFLSPAARSGDVGTLDPNIRYGVDQELTSLEVEEKVEAGEFKQMAGRDDRPQIFDRATGIPIKGTGDPPRDHYDPVFWGVLILGVIFAVAAFLVRTIAPHDHERDAVADLESRPLLGVQTAAECLFLTWLVLIVEREILEPLWAGSASLGYLVHLIIGAINPSTSIHFSFPVAFGVYLVGRMGVAVGDEWLRNRGAAKQERAVQSEHVQGIRRRLMSLHGRDTVRNTFATILPQVLAPLQQRQGTLEEVRDALQTVDAPAGATTPPPSQPGFTAISVVDDPDSPTELLPEDRAIAQAVTRFAAKTHERVLAAGLLTTVESADDVRRAIRAEVQGVLETELEWNLVTTVQGLSDGQQRTLGARLRRLSTSWRSDVMWEKLRFVTAVEDSAWLATFGGGGTDQVRFVPGANPSRLAMAHVSFGRFPPSAGASPDGPAANAGL